MRGATRHSFRFIIITHIISTHAPHARRDYFSGSDGIDDTISTHAPHARRDINGLKQKVSDWISTHAPHARRDSD